MTYINKLLKNKKIASFLINDKYFVKSISELNPVEYFVFDRSFNQDYYLNGDLIQAKYNTYKQVQKNNADVMFLNWTAAAAIRRYVYIGHSEYILLPLNETLILPPVLIGLLRYATRGQLEYKGIFKSENTSFRYKYWITYKPNRKKYARGALRYYSPVIPKDDFFKKLQVFNYCLLRWHERLDFMTKDEDLDILVADKDVEGFLGVLEENIGTLPIGLYSVSGNVNINQDRISYYPPRLAEKILSNTITGPKHVKIPNPEIALLSFIYHLLYHKGYKSGLKSKFNNKIKINKYVDYLKLKADTVNIELPETMEELAEFLEENNWTPSNDMLNRYAISNAWVKDYYVSSKSEKFPPGLVVFLVRELADKKELIDEITKTIKDEGFLILRSEQIENHKKEYISKNIRGGNWCENPASTISGFPAWFIIAFDPNPITPERKQKDNNPVLDNQRIEIKSRIRKTINNYFPQHYRTNVLHTSDNSEEALDYIHIILSETEMNYYATYLFEHSNYKD